MWYVCHTCTYQPLKLHLLDKITISFARHFWSVLQYNTVTIPMGLTVRGPANVCVCVLTRASQWCAGQPARITLVVLCIPLV